MLQVLSTSVGHSARSVAPQQPVTAAQRGPLPFQALTLVAAGLDRVSTERPVRRATLTVRLVRSVMNALAVLQGLSNGQLGTSVARSVLMAQLQRQDSVRGRTMPFWISSLIAITMFCLIG
jgi:hypothetical protein